MNTVHRIQLAGVLAIVTVAAAWITAQGPAHEFRPDSTFTGSSLAGWHTLGGAQWKAQNGELIGTASGPGGGWLVLDTSYQDLNFFARFRCAGLPTEASAKVGECRTGVLFRAEKTDAGMTGVYVSLNADQLAAFRVTLDAMGRETTREPLRAVTPFIRSAPPAAPATAGRAGGPARGGAGGGGGAMTLPVPLAPLTPASPGLRASDWNTLSVALDADIIRSTLNEGIDILPGATDDRASGYGPVALFVGSGEVHFKDVSFKDLNTRVIPPEQTSTRFRMQQLDEFFYTWGAGTGDLNRDGVLDVVAGPYYYLGPDYTSRREIYVAPTVNPSDQFPRAGFHFVFDFTGDGWPDVVSGENRPLFMYVNPREQRRRWAKYPAVPQGNSELVLMRDLDGDSKPEAIFGTGTGTAKGTLAYARPDPADPTRPWVVHTVSAPGMAYAHSLGAGDVNGDGRIDILQTAGWWEQPAASPKSTVQSPESEAWIYHPEAFGRWGRAEGAGGAELCVYDVNGDKLNDVVTGLNAHGFGLAWFEQKRDKEGRISFERHMIIDDYSTKNAGNVTMSEMHASLIADIDGDGIPDYVTGKRYFSHLESTTDPDPYGTPALYWFRTVRNRKAPGGAEFVPELIHNRSGVGSQFAAADLNKDGAIDIVTSNVRGTFIFWGRRR
jgi:hypothetical protein